MNRVRVMHVLPDLMPYGLERIVATLAQLGDRERFDVQVCSMFGEEKGSLAEQLRADGITVYHLDKKKGLDPRMWPRFTRLFANARPEIIHTHNYVLRYVLPAAMLTPLGSRLPRIVHTIHNTAAQEVDFAGRLLQKWAFRGRVQPVTISEEGAASYSEVYRLPAAPMIRNGITVGTYAHPQVARSDWRRAEGFAPDDLLYTCVARFYEQKNHAVLVDAFAKAAAKLPRAKLLLAGTGYLEEPVREQIERLNLAGRVRMLGQRDDIASLLGASDVFALASLWEGNPLSVMEALAAGLPVAATRVGAIPELAIHREHGLIVEPGDAGALAAAMIEFGRDGEFRIRAGRAAAQRARERFDHQQMVDAYEALYDTIYARPEQHAAAGRTVTA